MSFKVANMFLISVFSSLLLVTAHDVIQSVYKYYISYKLFSVLRCSFPSVESLDTELKQSFSNPDKLKRASFSSSYLLWEGGREGGREGIQ